jgi:hypothetical protein
MSETHTQRSTMGPSVEFAVSRRAVSKFSRWLNLEVTRRLRALDGKEELCAPLTHRGQVLGSLHLKKVKNQMLVVEVSLSGEVLRYLGEVKNHNVFEFKGRGFIPVATQVEKPELAGAVRRWCEIDRGSCDGLM